MAQQDKRQKVDLHTLLEETPISVVLKEKAHGPLLVLDHSTRIIDAIDELGRAGYISAPVVLGGSSEDEDGGTYLGLVDVNSILNHILKGLKQGCFYS